MEARAEAKRAVTGRVEAGNNLLVNSVVDLAEAEPRSDTIPAMSAETERIFSGAKITISPSRNRLGDDVIEATECLNRWYRAGL